jgi:hypothetical protein
LFLFCTAFSRKYVSLLKGFDPRDAGLTALDTEGNEGEILRDMDRTFPRLTSFADPDDHGQRILANVLLACKNYHPSVGYCQGMNCVAAILIMAAFDYKPKARDQLYEATKTSGITGSAS